MEQPAFLGRYCPLCKLI